MHRKLKYYGKLCLYKGSMFNDIHIKKYLMQHKTSDHASKIRKKLHPMNDHYQKLILLGFTREVQYSRLIPLFMHI